MPIEPVQLSVVPYVSVEHSEDLLNALQSGDFVGVQVALAQGATIPMRDEDGWTPLMWAAIGDDRSVIDLVWRFNGVPQSVNATNGDGATALMVAAENGSAVAMQRLLELGAEANMTHPCGSTALLLFLASRSEDWNGDLIQSFVAAGVDLEAVDADGTNAIMFAVQKFSPETVSYVAQEMSPHRINDVDARGYTALFYAAQRSLPMAQLLVANGARANLVAPDGMTPEQMARDFGSDDVARFLRDTAMQQSDPLIHDGV